MLAKTIWDRLNQGNNDRPVTTVSNQKLVGVEGSPLKVIGSVHLNIVLEQQQFNANFLVADSLTTEAILGRDFLRDNHCVIDVGKSLIKFENAGITLNLMGSAHNSQIAHVSVIVDATLQVPGCSEIDIMAKVPSVAKGGSWIVESIPAKNNAVMVARTLVSPCNQMVPVRVLNPRPERITVSKGTTIATMEAVAVVAATSEDQSTQKQQLLTKMVQQIGDHVSSIQREQLLQLLLEFSDIFAAHPNDLGHTNVVTHHIDTGNAHPIRQQVRRAPVAKREETHRLLNDMLQNDVIQPSSSPWASPVVLVQKHDGSQRFCIDYRKLNRVTKRDAYPIPRIDDTLDTLAGSCWFSTLDLVSGYWQVEVAQQDREKMAFCVPEGLFEFKVLPFGLNNAPATFQRLMDLLLSGLKWKTCLVYLDDVIIFAHTFEEHLHRLKGVFERFREAGVKLKPSKCLFCRSQVQFLGHVISSAGISTDPSKTILVADWPTPTSGKDVQKFLGLASYYRRFVPACAAIAKPLHRLTEKTAKFKWSTQCEQAFIELKQRLTSAPILALPEFSEHFVLDTDASDVGIGAVLSQKHANGSERVIAYASRVLSKPERRYCVTRKELLAAISFVKHFCPYLLGKPFTLRTDHSSLTWLYNFKNPEGQLARWLEALQEYHFTIEHRKGCLHGNADAMSRRPCSQCGRDSHTTMEATIAVCKETNTVVPERSNEDIRKLQMEDQSIGFVLRAKEANDRPSPEILKGQSLTVRRLIQLWPRLLISNGTLCRKYEDLGSKQEWTQLVVPQSLREEVMEELHAGIMGGHVGESKTLQQVKRRFYWPGSLT